MSSTFLSGNCSVLDFCKFSFLPKTSLLQKLISASSVVSSSYFEAKMHLLCSMYVLFCCYIIYLFLLQLKVKNFSLRKMCPYSELFWSVFFPHCPAFGLNTERYEVSHLSVFSPNAGKMRTRITPNTDSFCAVSAKRRIF